MSRRFIVVVFALFLAFTWSLAQDVPQATAEDEPLGGLYGGDFIIAVPQDAVFSLDPTGDPDETSEHIIDLLYDSLARIHPETLMPIPWVASGWTIDDVNKTVLVTLRDDVTWHDGENVTADDVVYTYESAYTVTKVSTYAVSFNLSGRDYAGTFLTEGLTSPLVKSGDSTPSEGCGPFELLDNVPGDHVTIGAYDDYFDGRPYLDTVTFRIYSGFDEASEAMINGEIGLIGRPLTGTESSVFLNYSNETIVSRVSVFMNPTFKFLYVGMNTQEDPLDNPIIRKAIAMCTDKDLYLTMVPYTLVADSVIHPINSYWLNSSVPRYRVKYKVEGGERGPDLDAVKIMLDESGYTDKDSDGLRERPDNSEFHFDFYYPSSSIEVHKDPIAKDLIGKLQTIGFDVRNKEMLSWEDLYFNVTQGSFDIFMGVLDAKREPSFIRDVLHSSGSANYMGYSNPTLDQILEEADAALSVTERQELVKHAQGWIAEENPIIPMLHYKVKEAVNRTKFTGWVNMAEGVYNFWSFRNLHLTQGDPLRVSVIILASQISSGEVLSVKVEVNHPETFASMHGVFVTVTESLDPDTSYTGYTDNGSFEFTWTAPALTEPDTAVFIARAITPGYPEGAAQGEITVDPEARVLLVDLARNPARISSGDTASITVTVRDLQTLAVVEGAEISLRIAPEELEGSLSNPSGMTDANGVFQTTFTASVTVDTTFLVIAEVSKTGYSDGADQKAVFVDRSGGTAPPLPGLEAISIMLMLIAVTLGYAYLRRTKRD